MLPLPMSDAPGVLVVEDSPTTSQILALTLRKAGYEPVVVRCVQEAQAHLRECVPGVVVTDLRLPDTSGLTLCRFIRGDTRYAGVKIVLVSGVPRDELAQECFPGAYDTFLEKPFSLRQL